MGTFEQFAVDIDNEEKRKKLYDSASKIYALGDFDTFSKDLGYEKQAPAVEPVKPVVGKPVEAEMPQTKETPVPQVETEADPSFPMFDDKPNPPINPEQETVRGFGAGFKQGIKQMGSGLKALGGEIANLFTGTTRDERAWNSWYSKPQIRVFHRQVFLHAFSECSRFLLFPGHEA